MKICTIELNLDDDFANSTSYHVDYLSETIKRNLLANEEKIKGDRWVLVGLANSLTEGIEKSKEIQLLLCKRNNKNPKGIYELLEDMVGDFDDIIKAEQRLQNKDK